MRVNMKNILANLYSYFIPINSAGVTDGKTTVAVLEFEGVVLTKWNRQL